MVATLPTLRTTIMLEQWCPTKFSHNCGDKGFSVATFVRNWEIFSSFIIRNPFLRYCMSPHLNLFSPHVTNGDKVKQHWIWFIVMFDILVRRYLSQWLLKSICLLKTKQIFVYLSTSFFGANASIKNRLRHERKTCR